jgi:hypothetical protein
MFDASAALYLSQEVAPFDFQRHELIVHFVKAGWVVRSEFPDNIDLKELYRRYLKIIETSLPLCYLVTLTPNVGEKDQILIWQGKENTFYQQPEETAKLVHVYLPGEHNKNKSLVWVYDWSGVHANKRGTANRVMILTEDALGRESQIEWDMQK